MEMLLNNNRPPNRYPSAGLGRGYRNLSAISQSVLVGAERRPACYKCGSVSHMSNECGRVAETKEVERTTAGDLTREDLLVVIDDVFTSSGAAGTSNGDNLYETVSSPKLSPTDQHSAPIWPISPASSTTDVRVNLQQYNPRAACFNCRQMGHVQGDCTNERVEPRSQLSRGEPRGFEYIPEEIPNTEEALFGDHIPMGDNIACLYELEVQMSGVNCPDPIEAFSEADLKDELMANVKLAEYSAPTPIQKTAIPVIKSQRDLLALAPTGSGKTAAYILPIVDAIMRDDKLYPNAPYAMVLAPTHELSTQIFKEFKKFTFGTKIKIANIYGQVSMAYQIALMCGTHIVVGTPGRIKEMIMREYILLHKLKFFVLDECDRMLEMGMLGDMKDIVNLGMPGRAERQTLLFSATASDMIQGLAETFMHDRVTVYIGIVGGANVDVRQEFVDVTLKQKTEVLVDLLQPSVKDSTKKSLVFLSQRLSVDWLRSHLETHGIKSVAIHAGHEQQKREESLKEFRNGQCGILLATDVAARGLDIPGVDHVINFDMPYAGWLSKHGPTDYEMIVQYEIATYVHRIGRTGRIGNPGLSTSFFDTHKDIRLAKPLLKVLREAEQQIPQFLADLKIPGGFVDLASTGFGVDKPTEIKDQVTESKVDDSWD